MSNPTSNFGWQMPTNTDLVTDLPADFEVFGQAVDSSMADLKGGTSGQILSKNSNTDMDFVWIANDQGDITGVTATSPLTGGGTSGAITVGIQDASTSQKGAVQLSDSASTTSSTVAATSTAVKAAYDPAFTNNFYAGKNKIINGDFGIWQRGTSVNITTNAFWADRFSMDMSGAIPTGTASRQTFTAGTAPVAGYESNFFGRVNITAHNNCTEMYIYQRMENVTTFANQTIAFSVWLKADAAVSMGARIVQNFGSGGSTAVATNVTGSPASVTTGWTRFTFTVLVPSIAGKTIGTGSSLEIRIVMPTSGGFVRNGTYDCWGLQAEAGSTATPFQTATGTLQGELAACQRYYWRFDLQAVNSFGFGFASSIANGNFVIPYPVTMRTAPTALEQSGTTTDYTVTNATGNQAATAVPTFGSASKYNSTINCGATLVAGEGVRLRGANTNAYLGWSAEL